ncbi:hypothetical protein [Siphovirus Jomon_CT89]|nr:hypothetical protein [Siphovirus Jomon_CT89]
MILEVDDQGRLERIAVINGNPEKTLEGRRLIGGFRLNTSGFEEIWFDKAVWDATLISDVNGIKKYRLVRKTS